MGEDDFCLFACLFVFACFVNLDEKQTLDNNH